MTNRKRRVPPEKRDNRLPVARCCPSPSTGFVPGEGAGFCLLMTDQMRVRLGIPSLVTVKAAKLGKETKLIKTTDMCLGEGLTATVRNALSDLRLPDERINEIFCDINGERYRGEGWDGPLFLVL